jgi:hypothetical protein
MHHWAVCMPCFSCAATQARSWHRPPHQVPDGATCQGTHLGLGICQALQHDVQGVLVLGWDAVQGSNPDALQQQKPSRQVEGPACSSDSTLQLALFLSQVAARPSSLTISESQNSPSCVTVPQCQSAISMTSTRDGSK